MRIVCLSFTSIAIAMEVTPTTLCLGYVGLFAVNTVFGAGLFGVPTNGAISAAYPTYITPAGFTFAIWGPIFLLQAGGTALMASGAAPTKEPRVASAWLATWAFQCVWQFVFCNAPVPPETATAGAKLLVLAPAAVLLAAAWGSMLTACARLRFAPPAPPTGPGVVARVRALCAAAVVDLPTGLNAGWLAAASAIGATLVLQLVAPGAAEPKGGAVLLGAVTGLGAVLSAVFGGSRRSLLVGLGYAAATGWACYGITKAKDVTGPVNAAAAHGMVFAAAGAVAALVMAGVDAARAALSGARQDEEKVALK